MKRFWKIIFMFALMISCLNCSKDTSINSGVNENGTDKYNFVVDKENEKYLKAELYPIGKHIYLFFNYEDYGEELVIPPGTSYEEEDKLRDEYNKESWAYYLSNNTNFINQLGLDNLTDYVYISQFYSYVTYEIDINEYVSNVENQLKKLENNNKVKKIEIYDITEYSRILRINPSYYGLSKYQSLDYKLLNDPEIRYLPSGIYSSYNELTNATNEVIKNISEFEVKNVLNEVAKYKDFDYKNNYLVISERATCGSGSIKMRLESMYLKNNTIYMLIEMAHPVLCTDNTQDRFFISSIRKNKLKSGKEYKIEVLY